MCVREPRKRKEKKKEIKKKELTRRVTFVISSKGKEKKTQQSCKQRGTAVRVQCVLKPIAKTGQEKKEKPSSDKLCVHFM